MTYSFVLILAPQLCGEQMFKRYRSFIRSKVDETNCLYIPIDGSLLAVIKHCVTRQMMSNT